MSVWRARVAEAQAALMLLTRLPAGPLASSDVPDLRTARWAFPLIGVPVGAITWGVFAGAVALGLPPMVASFLALGALALVTGALHFDGLADFADGIGGGRDRAHCLEIMRDSRIGSYGVLALVVIAGLWVSSVAAAGGGLLVFVAVAVFSRSAIVAVQGVLAPAREDGLGAGASGQSPAWLVAAAAILAIVSVLGAAGVALAVAGAAAAAGTAWMAHRRIGGQTGDVLGAVQLISETAAWVAFAAYTATA